MAFAKYLFCFVHIFSVIDTKYLAMHPLVSPHMITTGLESVSQCVQQTPFSKVGPKICKTANFKCPYNESSLE